MVRRFCALLACVSISALTQSSVFASEVVNYSYDARGRVVQVAKSGSVNNGVTASYGYDPADNRTSVTVTGAPSAPPSFSIASASATEGDNLTFNVTKTGAALGTLTVNFATASGTALSGTDFIGGGGTLTFLAADTVKVITVSTIQDSLYEGAENFTLTLSGASSGSTISNATATGTINDDDPPPTPPSFAINDVSVTEGGTLAFTVTKTGSTSSSYSLDFATANVTAAAGSDYTAASGTLTFAAADTSKTISVATTDDATVESTETLNVNLSNATGGATFTDSQGVGTITDNDTPPASCSGISFAVGDDTVLEGYPLSFVVTKSGSTSISCSVNYATANGTASSTSDYTAKSGTLTFLAGETTKTVSVTTLINGPLESDEVMYLNLSSASGGASITDSQGAGTLINNTDGGGGGGGGGGCPITCR